MTPGVLTVYRWELRKLRAQKRTYLGLGAAAAVPIIFVVALATQSGGPNDVAFGRYVHDTGLAIPLVLLLFGSVWMFPLITAWLRGHRGAEDRHGTLKTIRPALSNASRSCTKAGHGELRDPGDRDHGRGRPGGHPRAGFNPSTLPARRSPNRGLGLVWASLVYLIPSSRSPASASVLHALSQ